MNMLVIAIFSNLLYKIIPFNNKRNDINKYYTNMIFIYINLFNKALIE